MDCFYKSSVCLTFVMVIIQRGNTALLDVCAGNAACKVSEGDSNAVCSKDTNAGGDANGNCICIGAFKNSTMNDACVATALLDVCADNAACRVTEGDSNAVCSNDTNTGGDTNGNCICIGLFKNSTTHNGCVAKAVSDYTCDPTSNDASNGGAAVCAALDNNAECPTGTTKCACKSGYKEDTTNVNTCVKVLASTCASNGDCTGTVPNSECASTTCSCVAGYKEVNNLCIKAVSDYTCDPTSNDASNGGAAVCAAVDTNAECPTGTTKCACKSGYKEDTTNVNTCVKVLGSTCNAVGDCTGTVPNSECSELKCSCTADYIEESHICKKALGKTCSNVNECVTNAECDTTCMCSSGFINSGGLCAAESSATSAWVTTSMVRTSLLIYVLKLIC